MDILARGRKCLLCPRIKEGVSHRSSYTGLKYKIKHNFTCKSKYLSRPNKINYQNNETFFLLSDTKLIEFTSIRLQFPLSPFLDAFLLQQPATCVLDPQLSESVWYVFDSESASRTETFRTTVLLKSLATNNARF